MTCCCPPGAAASFAITGAAALATAYVANQENPNYYAKQFVHYTPYSKYIIPLIAVSYMSYNYFLRLTNTIIGTENDDDIYGTEKNDHIELSNGNDKGHGLGGNDYICGGADDDEIDGGAGNDKLCGGAGKNKLTGGTGHDTFIFKPVKSFNNITDFEHNEILDFSRLTDVHGIQDLWFESKYDQDSNVIATIIHEDCFNTTVYIMGNHSYLTSSTDNFVFAPYY